MTYVLFWVALPTLTTLTSERPEVLVIPVLALLLYRWLPDPALYLAKLARVRRLKARILSNPQDINSRRDLAMLYLAQRRPKKAIATLQPAFERGQGTGDARLLLGKAYYQAGDFERCVELLLAGAEAQPKLAYGEPLLVAAEALHKLGRVDEAIATFERYLKINTSSVEGFYRMAAAMQAKADAEAAKRLLQQAVRTYSELPGFLRRRQLAWYLQARARLLVA
jgi:tetratricopeptide (TPR) repeat protein